MSEFFSKGSLPQKKDFLGIKPDPGSGLEYTKVPKLSEYSCLIWPKLKCQDSFNDVTLASEDCHHFKAHIVILEASSQIVKLVESC